MSSSFAGGRPLVVIVGPTASGKSALGVFLAQQLGGEVLVCDSAQISRHFDIGTGKVTEAARQGVPHHLLDLCEPTEEFTAGDYLRRGREVLAEVSGRGRLPIVTAGTGVYLGGLLGGGSPLPPRPPPRSCAPAGKPTRRRREASICTGCWRGWIRPLRARSPRAIRPNWCER